MNDPVPTYERDRRVDDYIEALPDWQREVCRRLRDLIHGWRQLKRRATP